MPFLLRARSPKPSAQRFRAAVCVAWVSALLSLVASCQVPSDMSASPEGMSQRSPVSALLRGFDTAGRAEDPRELEFREEKEDLLRASTYASAREQASALARAFGRSGAIARAPWWSQETRRPVLDHEGAVLEIGLDEIYRSSLQHSHRVKVHSAVPLIRETAIDEAEGEFEPEWFAQTRYDHTDEPTSTSLETGQEQGFLRERGWTYEGGVRKRLATGASVSVGQELSETRNNSLFFSPPEQGRARLKLSATQPLLRGAGREYNHSLIRVAELRAESGHDELVAALEAHLIDVNLAYWRLYYARAVYLEKRRLVRETEKVVSEIDSRGDLDAIASQRSRARAALASRKSELVRSELEVKNNESRLRLLVNDPVFAERKIGEIIPADLPVASMAATDFETAVAEALENRPEVHLAAREVRIADVREGVARNETRPTLDLVSEVGVSALRGSGDWTGAFADQYNDGRPSWGVGLVASIPWERKSAKARLLRAELETRQSQDQLRAALDEVLLEVQIAHREVATAWPEAKVKWEAAEAAEQELTVLTDRREIESAELGTSLYLERLLDAQQRRAFAREDFLLSLVTYNAALASLERAKGTLLQAEGFGIERAVDENALPLIQVTKAEAALHAKSVYANYR